MDLDFDDQLSDHAAPAAKAGAKFKPKGRPLLKKKQVSLLNSQTTKLSTDVAKDILSTQMELTSETIVSDSGTINQSNDGTISKEKVGGVDYNMRPSFLSACSNVGLERKMFDDGIEVAPAFLDDPQTQDSSTFGDFVTFETDEVTHVQTQRLQTEEECQLDMETLDIVQEECITSAYEQHTGKFLPKPRLFDTLIEEPGSHDSVDDTGYLKMGINEADFMVDMEARNNSSTNSTFSELQEEELYSHEVPSETTPEMETQDASGKQDQDDVLPSTDNTIIGDVENCLDDTIEEERARGKSKKGKSKGTSARKRKITSEDDPNKSSENPQKKFKHSTRRPRKRTLEKELLETPDEEIRYLPIRDMLRLVEYKEWLEKKGAKGAAVVPPAQESSNMNALGNQYQSQGFDAEDEFGIEESENQETYVVKPDSPVNYQTYMKKTSRTRWSKQDTELFYEGIREFGSNLSMVQQLFPKRTREQIKLKFKLEERREPLKLNDALSSRSKDLTHFQNVIKKLQQEAAAAREGEEGEEGAAETETTSDVPENEEEPTTEKAEEIERGGEEEGGVKESDGGDECNDEGDDDDDFWNSYKSEM